MTIGLATSGYLAPAGTGGGGLPQIAPPTGSAEISDFAPPAGMAAIVDLRPDSPERGMAHTVAPGPPSGKAVVE